MAFDFKVHVALGTAVMQTGHSGKPSDTLPLIITKCSVLKEEQFTSLGKQPGTIAL